MNRDGWVGQRRAVFRRRREMYVSLRLTRKGGIGSPECRIAEWQAFGTHMSSKWGEYDEAWSCSIYLVMTFTKTSVTAFQWRSGCALSSCIVEKHMRYNTTEPYEAYKLNCLFSLVFIDFPQNMMVASKTQLEYQILMDLLELYWRERYIIIKIIKMSFPKIM